MFPCSFVRRTDDVENPWGISCIGELVGILSSKFLYLNIRDALQRVNSVVWLACYKFYSMYRVFLSL